MAMKLTVLSEEAIEQALEAQRAALPGDVAKTIEGFNAVHNKTIAKTLLKTINKFKNPAEAFALWQEYYRSGDDVALKKSFAQQKFSLLSEIRQTSLSLKNSARLEGKNPYAPGQFLKRMVFSALNPVLTKFVAKKINGVSARQFAFMGAFQVARRWVESPTMNHNPVFEALQPELKKAFDEKLTVDLKTLKAAAKAPLLPPAAASAVEAQAVIRLTERFNRIAGQSFGADAAPTREIVQFDPDAFPEDARFGVELEGFIPAKENAVSQRLVLWSMFQDLKIRVNFPLTMPKSDIDYSKWTITFDSSVQDPLHFTGMQSDSARVQNAGMEIISPVLKGPDGARELQKVVAILKNLNFTTNESCGYHIHNGLEDTSLEQRKALAKAYVSNEKTIDGYVDPARRVNGNPFAKSVAGTDIAAIDAAADEAALVEIMNPKRSRDSKFNVTNLGYPGAPQTAEYRGEGGPGYLDTCLGYTAAMVSFTRAALDNAEADFGQVVQELNGRKVALPAPPSPMFVEIQPPQP